LRQDNSRRFVSASKVQWDKVKHMLCIWVYHYALLIHRCFLPPIRGRIRRRVEVVSPHGKHFLCETFLMQMLQCMHIIIAVRDLFTCRMHYSPNLVKVLDNYKKYWVRSRDASLCTANHTCCFSMISFKPLT